ncbi:MAG: septation protein A [Betaproteobacteria bacterium]|nr:septation protein A [Betaproteobacteria bacterium]
MKLFFDLFPILLFFIAFKLGGIYVATWVTIAATFAQILWVYFRHGRVDGMLWASLVIVVVFGGATLLFHDATFIKWKPTVLDWMFAVALLGSSALFKKNLIKTMMKTQIALPETVWSRLNVSWALFFAFMGTANLYVAYHFPTDVWVNFKAFWSTGLMLLFALGQGFMISKHVSVEGSE